MREYMWTVTGGPQVACSVRVDKDWTTGAKGDKIGIIQEVQ